MERTLVIALTALVGASVAAGCGDDKDDGGGDVSTGIAPTKLLSDVTAEEAASACLRLQAGFERVFAEDKLIRSLCTLQGVAFADTTADCVTFRDDCIEEASMPDSSTAEMVDDVEGITCDGEGDAEISECTGTVGQLETCFNDTLDRFDALLNMYTCEDAASVEPEDLEGFGDMVGEPPASCEAVGCPGDSPFGGEDSSDTAQ
ncbi:MAG TPA: hypothetical protein VMG12_01705 [Polyangiaceae bacterium]|nr:hypothetical protein [Polyangiaceae bacterium]